MWEKGSFPPAGVESCGLRVFSVWKVSADSSYDVKRGRLGKRFIAVRTLEGEGILYFENGIVELKKNNIIFIYSESLKRYRCKDNFWHFHWVEFVTEDSNGIIFNTPLNVKEDEIEKTAFEELFHLIRESGQAERDLGTAFLSLIIRKWICAFGEKRNPSKAENIVRKITRKMHEKLGDRWSVAEMAADAGVGERYLRKIFNDIVSMGPKQYYETLKLNTCRELLELNLCNIKEAAFRTGFSSQFHLSREFKKYFGAAPSKLRKR
ncbi:MAG: hypothetical protein A2020_06720 [Lentisphaerae bacterium GWF2_45_14]|nr:MAG: hypothetical protein A2020_06720 [Lentisphaerae bacterium GWF2_45_14]